MKHKDRKWVWIGTEYERQWAGDLAKPGDVLLCRDRLCQKPEKWSAGKEAR